MGVDSEKQLYLFDEATEPDSAAKNEDKKPTKKRPERIFGPEVMREIFGDGEGAPTAYQDESMGKPSGHNKHESESDAGKKSGWMDGYYGNIGDPNNKRVVFPKKRRKE